MNNFTASLRCISVLFTFMIFLAGCQGDRNESASRSMEPVAPAESPKTIEEPVTEEPKASLTGKSYELSALMAATLAERKALIRKLNSPSGLPNRPPAQDDEHDKQGENPEEFLSGNYVAVGNVIRRMGDLNNDGIDDVVDLFCIGVGETCGEICYVQYYIQSNDRFFATESAIMVYKSEHFEVRLAIRKGEIIINVQDEENYQTKIRLSLQNNKMIAIKK